MGYQIKCNNCLATKWYIIQDELLQSIKEMKVRKSQLPFWKWNVVGTLCYTIIYVHFQSLYFYYLRFHTAGYIKYSAL